MRLFNTAHRIILVTLLVSCHSNRIDGGSVKEGSAKPADADQTPDKSQDSTAGSTPDAQGDDSITVPATITGALLQCSSVEDTANVEIRVACHFTDGKGNTLPPGSVAEGEAFVFSSAAEAGPTQVSILPPDKGADVTFVFSGANIAQMRAFIAAGQLEVDLIGLKNGEANKEISVAMSQVAKPLPWVREATTDSNKNGQCDAGEVCIYSQRNLLWFRDLGTERTFDDAFKACGMITAPGLTGWRLPTQAELQQATAAGMWNYSAANALSIKDKGYWSAEATEDASPGAAIFPRTGAVEIVSKTELRPSFCVRNQ